MLDRGSHWLVDSATALNAAICGSIVAEPDTCFRDDDDGAALGPILAFRGLRTLVPDKQLVRLRQTGLC
jgi:hypothetical protein